MDRSVMPSGEPRDPWVCSCFSSFDHGKYGFKVNEGMGPTEVCTGQDAFSDNDLVAESFKGPFRGRLGALVPCLSASSR